MVSSYYMALRGFRWLSEAIEAADRAAAVGAGVDNILAAVDAERDEPASQPKSETEKKHSMSVSVCVGGGGGARGVCVGMCVCVCARARVRACVRA